MAQIEENTNVVGYVGARINARTMKRYLARARVNPNPPKGTRHKESHGERAAIRSLILGAPLKYIPAPKKTSDRAAEITDAIKNREAVQLRS